MAHNFTLVGAAEEKKEESNEKVYKVHIKYESIVVQ